MSKTLHFDDEELYEITDCLLSRYRMIMIIKGNHDNELKTIIKITEKIKNEL